MKVIVLGGADSPEREVSIRSSKAIFSALKEAGFDVVYYDPIDGIDGLASLIEEDSIVFPILHGVNGEDGVIQAELERIGVNYLGSTSTTSRVTFNKVTTHKKLQPLGIKMPAFAEVSKNNLPSEALFNRPFVLKPINGGSSVDTLVVRDVEKVDWSEVSALLEKYNVMIVEELIMGQEITVPVLGDEALPVIAIVPPADGEFDYENKYNGKSQEICPIPLEMLSQDKQIEAQNIALKVHSSLGVRHLSRTDIIIRSDGQLVVLEINTMPGMTEQSLFPKSASVAGLSMPDLVKRLVELVGVER